MEKCERCQKKTDKCCSLCRKMFYCSQQHQQVDWHSKHKYNCQGRFKEILQQKTPFRPQQFKNFNSEIYSKIEYIRQENQIAKILVLIEQRLTIRKRLINHLSGLNNRQSKTSIKQFVENCIKLVKLSEDINELYKPSFSKIIQDNHELKINRLILNMELSLDELLLAKAYQKSQMGSQLNELILFISKNLEDFDSKLISSQAYKNILAALLQFSKSVNADKSTQIFYGKFVKLVQQTEGVWEQIYSYYNLGIWYANGSYYDKCIKTLEYTIELLTSHKSNQQEDVALFRADCHFNIGLCYYAKDQVKMGIEQMKQAHKLRVRGVGKNSIETSQCLQYLAKWSMQIKEEQNSLMYLQECYLIRKKNQKNTQELERVIKLSKNIYEMIKLQKQKREENINPKQIPFYQNMLRNFPKQIIQNQRQTFSERILKDDKQFVLFKINITPQMVQELDADQCQMLSSLIEHTDKKMEKSEAISLLTQSNFFKSLNQNLRREILQINNYS